MSDPDQESYSIDEMLNRLRSRNQGPTEGDAQLVTRADGTQAVKVRRRKRRSHQPHKEEEKRRRKRNLVIASLVIGVVVAAALGVVGWIFYLNSSSYEDGVRRKVEDWSGAGVEFSRFRATPVSVGADQIVATWPEGTPVARLRLNHLRGDLKLSSHLGGNWTGQQLRAASGELLLRAPAPGGAGRPALPDGPMPFQVPLEANSLNVRFGDGERPALQVTGTRGSFRVPDPELPAGSIVMEGGRFRLGSWGAFNLEFASLHLGDEGLRLGNLRFHPESAPEASIFVDGQDFPEVSTKGGLNDFRVELKDMPSVSLLGTDLGRLVDTRFQTIEEDRGVSLCFFDVTDLSSIRLEAPLESALGSRVQINHLPCFSVLAERLKTPRLDPPAFQALAGAMLRRDATSVRLEGIRLLSRDELEVTGDIGERDGKLEGSLDIGLPESIVLSSRSLAKVFLRSSAGRRWATVKLSGTPKKPADDLLAQLEAAATVGEGPDTVEEGVEDPGLEDEFEELTTPPGGR